MPKLRRPDGRIVSVSEKGVEALKGRGYTDPDAPKKKTKKAEGKAPVKEAPVKAVNDEEGAA